jgi:hypothetical protein
MPERREPPRYDGAAWVLLLCGILVALSVFSDDAHPTTPNLLGPAGAWLARELSAALGSAVHLFLASWFVVVLMLLVRKSWLRWSVRLTGWLILLPCAAIAADWLGPAWIGGPLTGSGGAIGAWLHGWLQNAMPMPLAALAFAGAFVVGILLAADVFVRHVFTGAYYVCVALSWVFAVVAGRAEAWSAAWRVRPTAPPAAPKNAKGDIPIVHTHKTDDEPAEEVSPADEEAEAAAAVADEPPRILPIVRTPEVALAD